MIGYQNYSRWGIKDSGVDITPDMLDIISRATEFIIIGGYNFSFGNSGPSIFPDLRNRVRNGVPALIIMPPHLQNGNHLPAINFCISNNIALILNHNNHSKWILTDQDLYYGSSNFSATSWLNRIEVVSLHRFRTSGQRGWQRWTIQDFIDFVQLQITNLSRRRAMNQYQNLRLLTTNTWLNISNRIQRLNPDRTKVKESLEAYEQVYLDLGHILSEYFLSYDKVTFERIYKQTIQIQNNVNAICDYGYQNIYNEFETDMKYEDAIVAQYNGLHDELRDRIKESIESMESNKDTNRPMDLDFASTNESRLAQILERIKRIIPG